MQSIDHQLFAIVILIVALAIVLRILLGSRAYDEVKGRAAYDILRFFFLLPFRLMGWIFR